MDPAGLWQRLVRDLDGWTAAAAAGPGRVRVWVPRASGRNRRVEVVMTPEEWGEMCSVAWGSVDDAFASVKQTLLGLKPHEGFAVYADYRLEPSTSERLPDPGPLPEPGSGVWAAERKS